MFRSEKMALCQMFIQSEAAYATVSKLGEVGVVQFRDLNTGSVTNNRKFIAEVRLCDEMEQKLQYLQYILSKENIPIKATLSDEAFEIINPRQFFDLKASIDTDATRVKEPLKHYHDLKSRLSELKENIYVLEKAGTLVSDHFSPDSISTSSRSSSISDFEISVEDNGFLTGVIETQRLFAFERMIWRVSHGYALLKYFIIDCNNVPQWTDKYLKHIDYQY